MDLVQSGEEQVPDDELPFGEEDFFDGEGGGFFDEEAARSANEGSTTTAPEDRRSDDGTPEGDPDRRTPQTCRRSAARSGSCHRSGRAAR